MKIRDSALEIHEASAEATLRLKACWSEEAREQEESQGGVTSLFEAGGVAAVPAASLPAAARRAFCEGLEALGQGEADTASRCFERVLEAAPGFADGHVGLGVAFALSYRIYPALDHLEQAAELEPQNFYAHFKLGQLYFKLRIPQKAFHEMSRALGCATSPREHAMVARLLKEERQRENNGVRRPWWNRRFPPAMLYLAAGLCAVALVMLVLRLR